MSSNHQHSKDSDHNHHGHSHGNIIALKKVNNAFIIGIILNLSYVIIQITIGLHINSLALLADAGHNFLDVGTLALSLLAFKLNKSKPTENYTYGYKKTSILISLFNGMVLFISIGAIAYEAFFRFNNPQSLPGLTIALVSGLGILINFFSALLFFRDKEKDLNIKSAFMHLMIDALVSLTLVIGGIIIYYTHCYWIDALLSIIVCGIIIVSTWNLLKSSLRLTLNGVPENINLENIRKTALKINGILDIHHIHIWAISTSENAMTAHIILDEQNTNTEVQNIKSVFKHELLHYNIQHVTLETETNEIICNSLNCSEI